VVATASCTSGHALKYNDVRGNVLALAALQVWRGRCRRLMRTEMMEPIGASSNMALARHANSWVDIDGQKVSRWPEAATGGGACSSNAYDMARLAISSCATAHGRTGRSCRRSGSKMARTPGSDNPELRLRQLVSESDRKVLAGGTGVSHSLGRQRNNFIYIDRDTTSWRLKTRG